MKNRRDFLSGAAALGAGFLLPRAGSSAQSKTPAPTRIDVHSHFAPPDYISELRPKGVVNPQMFDWTPAKHIEEMDRAGVATAVTSISPPGIWFVDNSTARRIARICNDYAARFASDNKGRIGIFAALPVPDLDGSLKEVEYALDTLKADGISMYTNYGDKWLGDPYFAPLFEELNRRKAVVYTHPISANCCRNVLMPDIADSAIEWGTDTTRAITRLIFSGSAAKYPDIRWIFSHAGGTMPYLVERFNLIAKSPEVRLLSFRRASSPRPTSCITIRPRPRTRRPRRRFFFRARRGQPLTNRLWHGLPLSHLFRACEGAKGMRPVYGQRTARNRSNQRARPSASLQVGLVASDPYRHRGLPPLYSAPERHACRQQRGPG